MSVRDLPCWGLALSRTQAPGLAQRLKDFVWGYGKLHNGNCLVVAIRVEGFMPGNPRRWSSWDGSQTGSPQGNCLAAEEGFLESLDCSNSLCDFLVGVPPKVLPFGHRQVRVGCWVFVEAENLAKPSCYSGVQPRPRCNHDGQLCGPTMRSQRLKEERKLQQG